MILDAHSHSFSDQAVVQIDALEPSHNRPIYCSVSIHPWHAHTVNHEKASQLLWEAIKTYKPIAIGECGFDRLKKETLSAQTELWEIHLSIAKQLDLPMVIHCVKAYGDLFPYLKKNPQHHFILHGYASNLEQTKQLLRFNTWFSMGRVIMRNPKRVKEIISIIPSDRILIETDDSAQSIENFFQPLKNLLREDEEELRSQLFTNLKTAFKI
ncbi:MAG TPA: TatD family hydrolase [Salinivirgaceae bacterium]|nr:TatD family hydrolase [Salinivirgaceae bacterium]